jgi:hypothetical protein
MFSVFRNTDFQLTIARTLFESNVTAGGMVTEGVDATVRRLKWTIRLISSKFLLLAP